MAIPPSAIGAPGPIPGFPPAAGAAPSPLPPTFSDTPALAAGATPFPAAPGAPGATLNAFA
jgi:hypothetical protein